MTLEKYTLNLDSDVVFEVDRVVISESKEKKKIIRGSRSKWFREAADLRLLLEKTNPELAKKLIHNINENGNRRL